MVSPVSSGFPGLISYLDAFWEELKVEKRQLQKTLRRFEAEFEQQHGHAPKACRIAFGHDYCLLISQTNADRMPMMAQYRRYKELKTQLGGASEV